MSDLRRDRARWWEAICAELAEWCGPRRQEFIEWVEDSPVECDFVAALFVVSVCSELSAGVEEGEIVARIAESLMTSNDPKLAADVVRSVSTKWVTGVPIAQWWDPDLLLRSLIRYLGLIIDETQPAQLLDLLRRLLPANFFGDRTPEEYESRLVAFGAVRRLAVPELPTYLLATNKEPWAVFVRELTDGPKYSDVMTSIARRTYLGAADEPEGVVRSVYLRDGKWLLDWLAIRETWRLVKEDLADEAARATSGKKTRLSIDDAEYAVTAVETILTIVHQWERNVLTDLERDLIAPRTDQYLRLVRWLRHAYLMRHDLYFLMGVGAVGPDPRDGVPSWVASNVFNHGGRFVHGCSGTELYWMAVVEDELEVKLAQWSLRNSLSLALEEQGDDLKIFVTFGDRRDDMYLVPYYFDLSNLESILELAATFLAGASLHVFYLREEQELIALGRARLQFPSEMLDRFADRIDAILVRNEAGVDRPNYIAPYLEIDDQPPLSFSAAEQAKSEALLTSSAAEVSEDAQIMDARKLLAKADLARVSAELDGRLTEEHEVASVSARESLRVTLSKSSQITPSARPDALSKILSEVLTERRAFVHFYSEDGIEKLCVARIVDGEVIFSQVDDAELSTEYVMSHSRAWFAAVAEGQHDEAEAMLSRLLDAVGTTLLAPLAVHLLSAGIEHIVLSPDGALEPLPLHAAPVFTGTLQDLYDISYSPNVRLLSFLSSPGDGLQLDLVVCSDGSACGPEVGVEYLAGIEQEGNLLRHLVPAVTYVSGASATCDATEEHLQRSHVAHLMAHGRLSEDRMGSGLWMSGRTPSEALLSAARIEAGPSLASVSLIVLSACFSGTHGFGWKGVQQWRGLDAAFLSRGVSAVIGTLWPVDDLAALIYGQELHGQLAIGTDLLIAHHRAVNMLRTGKVSPESAAHLSDARPSWRSELDEIAMSQPYWWAPFRLSGRCWS